MMQALAELAVLYPINGAFYQYISKQKLVLSAMSLTAASSIC